MTKLAFRPVPGAIMVQYREGDKIQQFRFSLHDLMDIHSKDQFSHDLFRILDLLGVQLELMQQVGKIIHDVFAYPNHITVERNITKVMGILSDTFPSEDSNTDEALMDRRGIHGIQHNTRDKYIPLDYGSETK